MPVKTPRRALWHPLTAAVIIVAAAVGGASLHRLVLAAGAVLCWLAVGATAGFATSGST